MGHTVDATWRQDASTDFAVKQWNAFDDPSESTCVIWRIDDRYITHWSFHWLDTQTHTHKQTDMVISIPRNSLQGRGKNNRYSKHTHVWHINCFPITRKIWHILSQNLICVSFVWCPNSTSNFRYIWLKSQIWSYTTIRCHCSNGSTITKKNTIDTHSL